MDSATAPVNTSGMIRFHWIQLRGALRCEKAGMRHSSGKSARAAAAKELGMKRNSSFDDLISAINRKLNDEAAH